MTAEPPLGRPTPVPQHYDPGLLVGIPRDEGRRELGLGADLPFVGVDLWNLHELSWLDPRGKPRVATAELWVPAHSPRLVESKSLKLYLQSLNGLRQDSTEAVAERIRGDLTAVLGQPPTLRLTLPGELPAAVPASPPGECLDGQELVIDAYDLDPGLLDGAVATGSAVEQTLYSHLLRSRCPVTGQPDWATVVVHYRGSPIDRAALLRYIVSYRRHDAFHEHCVERIYVDIRRHCRPQALTVLARYTRRGGIDINPFRSDFETLEQNGALWRQ